MWYRLEGDQFGITPLHRIQILRQIKVQIVAHSCQVDLIINSEEAGYRSVWERLVEGYPGTLEGVGRWASVLFVLWTRRARSQSGLLLNLAFSLLAATTLRTAGTKRFETPRTRRKCVMNTIRPPFYVHEQFISRENLIVQILLDHISTW